MKKRDLSVIVGSVLLAISIAFLTGIYFDLKIALLSIVMNLFIVAAGSFLIYANYDLGNKVVRNYVIVMAGLLIALGLIPLLGLILPYTFAIKVPLIFYWVVLFVSSFFVLVFDVK